MRSNFLYCSFLIYLYFCFHTVSAFQGISRCYSASSRGLLWHTHAALVEGRARTRRYASTETSNESVFSSTESINATKSISNDPSKRKQELERAVAVLKTVLDREYTSFFDPMETSFYSPSVSFFDPLTTLSGVNAYKANVDNLSGRTFVGSLLFRDAYIVLHSVQGGEVTMRPNDNKNDEWDISDIVTRWTLGFTFRALPWQPTARFTGISVYKVRPGGPKGVEVLQQNDYWDSINLSPAQAAALARSNKDNPGGPYGYVSVGTGEGILHLAQLLLPQQQAAAPAAGPELPYQLLRSAKEYSVRKYPAFTAAQVDYYRRDLAFSALGDFTNGMTPLTPAIFSIPDSSDKSSSKTMMWPLTFAAPGSTEPPKPTAAMTKLASYKAQSDNEENNLQIVTVPERVVAVGSYTDASVEPVVRKVDKALQDVLKRDDLPYVKERGDTSLLFGQYDAVYSMGQRRGEVWIELEDGKHPWSTRR